MRPTPVLLPGNMCDARLWRGGSEAIPRTFAAAGLPLAHDADLTQDDDIRAMAARTLAAVNGPLLPVGFSMGAIVALAMAKQAPERIAGAVLIGLNATADLPERAMLRPRQQAEVRAGGLERVLVEEMKPNYLARVNRRDDALLALLRDMGLALGPEVFARQSEALRTRLDLTGALPILHAPVMLVAGAEDTLCPPEWHERWAALLPDAALHVIVGAGHMVPLEAPHRIADLLEVWLMENLCPTVS